MTPERWQQIEKLCYEALELDSEGRATYLNRACTGDEALRQEVESLLSAHGRAGNFLHQNAMQHEAAAMDEVQTIVPIARSFSHYRILSPIGAGGMGEVWLALDTNLDRRVAIKLLPAQFNLNTDRLQRFIREAKATSALNHPNIITVYEIGEVTTSSGKTRFIATEYIEGETLRTRMASGMMEQPEVLSLVIQIASALDAAHSAGIVHRDIKPENIMVRLDGLAKVLDFGLAKMAQPSSSAVDSDAPTIGMLKTEAGAVMGTVSYMSPEQARGFEVDARSDIFSFGILLYEMIAGERPFTGATASDVLASILRSDPPPLPNDTPDELQRIIAKALQKEPDARYQSAKGIEQDLKDFKRVSESGAIISAWVARNTQSSQSNSTAARGASSIGSFTTSSSSWFKRRALLALLLAGLLSIVAIIAYFATRAEEIDSIAVMPLEYAGGDAELEYLADGLTEGLINNLSQLPKLRVLSRSAVFRYKGQKLDIEQLASQLKARAIVTGRILRRGDRLEISLSLEDTQDYRTIWGQQYSRGLGDFLDLQSAAAKAISNQLRTGLSDEQKQLVAKSYTEDSQAYRLFSQGLFQQNKATEEGLNKSIEYFQHAIDADPNYALAYAAMATSYIAIASVYQRANEVIPLARQKAQKAIELDDNLAAGHSALAAIARSYDWNWAEAERESRRALDLNPNNALAYNELGHLYLAYKQTDEAITAFQRQLEIEPNSVQAHLRLGRACSFARRFDQAITTFRKGAELEPGYSLIYVSIAQIYGYQRKFDEALAQLDRAAALIKQPSDEANVISVRAQIYARMGRRAEAHQMLPKLLDFPKFIRPHTIALIYAALGENDQAIEWLEKAVQGRAPYAVDMQINPGFDGLHDDSRFQELLKRLNLP